MWVFFWVFCLFIVSSLDCVSEMPGALLQLAAYGVQDIYLTGNPQITFFVMVYKRHTNFAIECNEQLFTGEANFGKKFYCKIQRVGDLIGEMYLNLKLPELDDGTGDVRVSWINSIGHAIILNTEVEIGGEIIDKQYGQWLEIWSELTMPAEKRVGYDAMIGKHENFNAGTQGGALHLRVPLQFWFCRNKGLMLPLIAIQNNEVRINFEFRRFNDLWVSSDPDFAFPAECNFDVDHASLMVDYVFLEDEERRFFAKSAHFYLIEQLQMHSESLLNEKSDNVVNLDQFNHPCKELIWVIQTSTIIEDHKNEWFNFSDRPYGDLSGPGGGTDAKDNMTHAVLQINGQDRFDKREAEFFRIMEPYKYHLRVPNNFIYVYSFGFCPEEHQPSGSCNFSRIDNATLQLVLSNATVQSTNTAKVRVYATNYNVLRIMSGMGGLSYSN